MGIATRVETAMRRQPHRRFRLLAGVSLLAICGLLGSCPAPQEVNGSTFAPPHSLLSGSYGASPEVPARSPAFAMGLASVPSAAPDVSSSQASSSVPISVYGTSALVVGAAAMYYREGKRLSMRAEEEPKAPAKPKKGARIDAFDSLRFFLIAYIASGHFIFTATRNPLILKLISQINVVVGAFFVLSGYVAAYTTTKLGERAGTPRLDDAVQFAVSRIMGFWPLHFFVLLIFSPMFLWVDATYSGGLIAAWHGFISTGLLAAWFPLSAEVWNAPTWFLSALTFCFFILSYALKVLAGQSKPQLRRTLVILTIFSLLPKLAYSYDLKAWGIFEGMLNARSHPNYALFNSIRFSPIGALLEVLMGAAACRLVMLDDDKETGPEREWSFVPLAALVGIIVLRATGVIAVNDLLIRSALFIPIFLAFLMRLHRESVSGGGEKTYAATYGEGKGSLVMRFLNSSLLVKLGSISFPIFIVHGPLGQLFYKKAVATAVFGGSLAKIPGFFGVYWLVVIMSSYLLNEFFVKNKKVGELSKSLTAKICKALS